MTPQIPKWPKNDNHESFPMGEATIFRPTKIPQWFGKNMRHCDGLFAELSLFSLGFSQISWEKTILSKVQRSMRKTRSVRTIQPGDPIVIVLDTVPFQDTLKAFKQSESAVFFSQTATSTIVISKACPAALSLALSEEHQARLDCVPQAKTQMRPSEKHWQRHCGIPFEHWTTDFSKQTKTL